MLLDIALLWTGIFKGPLFIGCLISLTFSFRVSLKYGYNECYLMNLFRGDVDPTTQDLEVLFYDLRNVLYNHSMIKPDEISNEGYISGVVNVLRRSQFQWGIYDIFSQDEAGATPLHWALQTDNQYATNLILEIIKRNYDYRSLSATDYNKRTPIMWGSLGNSTECINLLLNVAAEVLDYDSITAIVNHQDKSGNMALHFATYHGNLPLSALLISNWADVNLCNAYGECPLHNAAASGNANLVSLLLENNGDPNVVTLEGITPFNYSSNTLICEILEQITFIGKDLKIEFLGAVKRNDLKSAGIILHMKETIEDLNFQDLDKKGPLHYASENGNSDMVELILAAHDMHTKNEKHKAYIDLNLKDALNRSPLHLAIQERHLDVAIILLRRSQEFFDSGQSMHQINLNSLDHKNRNVLLVAAENNSTQLVDYLLDYVDVFGKSLNLNDQDLNLWAPLHWAALYGNADMLGSLLAHHSANPKVKVNIKTIEGNCPLHLAVDISKKETPKALLVIAKLIKHGADVNCTNRFSLTPLQLTNNSAIAKLLIKKGA